MIGSIARVPTTLPAGRLTQDTVKLIFKPEAKGNESYLYWCLRTPQYRAFCAGVARGSAVVALSREDFLSYQIPDRDAGRDVIVAVLELTEEKIELNRKTNETLEQMAQALFKSWFVDFDPVHAKAAGRQPAGMDKATADLFPDSFVDSELGKIPKGWRVKKVGEFIDRLSVGQKYDQKTVLRAGNIPVFDQGKSGGIGFHNNEPGVIASADKPVVVFANHTCYMRLIAHPFSAIQNVLPFVGSGVDTFWTYYATVGRLSFSEYKGHWPDFIIQESVVPPYEITEAFGRYAKSLVAKIWANQEEEKKLTHIRENLLPKLLKGDLTHAQNAIAD